MPTALTVLSHPATAFPLPGTLAHIFLPLVTHVLYETEKSSDYVIVDEAIATIASISSHLPWSRYYSVIRLLLVQLQRRPEKEKVLMKAVCASIESFHFDCTEAAATQKTKEKKEKVVDRVDRVDLVGLVEEEEEEIMDDLVQRQRRHQAKLAQEQEQEQAQEQDSSTRQNISTTAVAAAAATSTAVATTDATGMAVTAATATNKITRTLLDKLLPSLYTYLIKGRNNTQKAGRNYDDGGRSVARKGAQLRVPIALAIVHLLQVIHCVQCCCCCCCCYYCYYYMYYTATTATTTCTILILLLLLHVIYCYYCYYYM